MGIWAKICAFAFLVTFGLNASAGCAAKQPFTDESLKALLERSRRENTRGVLYSWSPHMVFSFDGIPELKQFAKAHGIETTFVLDPFADQATVDMVASKAPGIESADCQRLQSAQLQALGITIHYPTYIFYQNGQLTLPRYQGYEEAYKLEALFKRKFKHFK